MRAKVILCIIISIAIAYNAAAQVSEEGKLEIDASQRQVDSILALITPATSDSMKMMYYNEIGSFALNPDTVIKYSTMSLEYCLQPYSDVKASNYRFLSWAYYMKDESKIALPYSFMALEISKHLNQKDNMALIYVAIAKRYNELNVRDSIFCFFDKALKLYTELNDSAHISYTYRAIGDVNAEYEFYKTAMEYYQKAFYIDSALQDYAGMADDYQNIGLAILDSDTDTSELALEYLKKSVAIFDTIAVNDEYFISSKYISYRHIAKAYIKLATKTGKKEYADSCYSYLKMVNNRYVVLGEYDTHIQTQLCYTQYLLFGGEKQKALDVLLECQQYLDEKYGKKSMIISFYKQLATIYQSLGDFENAFYNFKKMHTYNLSYINDSTLNVLADFQADQVGRMKDLQHDAEKKQLNTVIMSLIMGLIVVFISVFFVIRALRIKNRANKKLTQNNLILQQQKDEIEEQKELITSQWQEVASVNQKLVSSIVYAQRIQTAAIPKQSDINALFPENFVYYHPRDIVSGDFYQVACCGRYSVIITADCTGHGIPGAFLSMLGISAFKEFCIYEQDAENPGTILDRMRIFVKSTLTPETQKVMDDGMDITICSYDFDNMLLSYAAANQAAYLVRQGNITKLKGDRMPVGRYVSEKEHFQTVTLPIQKGDMIYTLSDGIQDQLGGDTANIFGQKFYAQNVEKMLIDIYSLPVDEQCAHIDSTIAEWRGGRPQVDDMTLIGIRV